MRNIILSSIIGFALGSTVTIFVVKGLPQGMNPSNHFSADLSSNIKNSTWATENDLLKVYFTDTDVCMFDLAESDVNMKFTYSVSDNKVFLNPEDLGSAWMSIGAKKLSWTFEYIDGYLVTDYEDNQLILKRIK